MSIPTATALTTGWESDLADADSLALRWLRHWSDQCAAFAGAAGGTVVRDERYVLADYGRPASFYNAADLPAPPLTGPSPQRVHTAAALTEWERVLVEGYPLRDLQPFQPGALVAPALLDDDRLRFWTTAADGSPAAISAQFVAHDVAGFALGVTLPAARRGGHWSRHARLRLHTEPARWHVGAFSDDSRPGAERLGFVPVVRHTLWHRAR